MRIEKNIPRADPSADKGDSIEYRVTDSLIALKDLSLRPVNNDRIKKLGVVNGTHGGYIVNSKLDRGLREIADGIFAGGASSMRPFEFDNFIIREHGGGTEVLGQGISDTVHALRLICDREKASPANRSTVVIDQNGAQRQADLNSIFHVILAPGTPSWQNIYNGAGEWKRVY